MKLFMENVTEYFAHVQTVCTRPLLGGEGPGDEASHFRDRVDRQPTQLLMLTALYP